MRTKGVLRPLAMIVSLVVALALIGAESGQAEPQESESLSPDAVGIISHRMVYPVALDGQITMPEEWADTEPYEIALDRVWGWPDRQVEPSDKTITARIKNDGEWIYLLYQVPWPAPEVDLNDAAFIELFCFGSCGSWDVNDIGVIRQNGVTSDLYGWTGSQWSIDIDSGGTNDVEGAATYDGDSYWYEFRKSLDSGDGFDWQLSPYQVVGNPIAPADSPHLLLGLSDPSIVSTYEQYVSIQLSSIVVNSKLDPGDGACDAAECTLREAIEAANEGAGVDVIVFDIPGDGPHTIQPSSTLPIITDPVTIDGTTQDGFSGSPVIELDGTLVQGAFENGLVIAAEDCTVRGLAINRFGRHGISIANGHGNVIEGNYLGTDVTGTLDLGNFFTGVGVGEGSTGNLIGGTDPGAGNVISGNDYFGVAIGDYGTSLNVVQGNLIGTDVTGTAPLGNTLVGVYLAHGTGDNLIGGANPGARNVISGNDLHGVVIGGDEDGASDNVVAGNFIGTDITGTVGLGNAGYGVVIQVDSADNLIGGTEPGAANIISDNGRSGVGIYVIGDSENLVQGNYIGTDVTGSLGLGNGESGVEIINSPSNTIGGIAPGEGNVISANVDHGVLIQGTGATGNFVQGNFVGTDASGSNALGNSVHGVGIDGGASGNTIGGSEPGARNVISGNDNGGVAMSGPGTSLNLVQGNLIGTDVTGTAPLGNIFTGIVLNGGPTNNEILGNVISDNGSSGVVLDGAGVAGNVIAGNFIGTDLDGINALPNFLTGVWIVNGATDNTIGGTDSGARNVISGNDGTGISIVIEEPDFLAPDFNRIQGNFIGTDVTGTQDLGNTRAGILIMEAPDNIVGGTGSGEGNVISGNDRSGIAITGSGASGNLVQGNYIGTDSSGSAGLGNDFWGVGIGAPDNIVEGNTIAFNLRDGVYVRGDIATGNTISQNSIHSNGLKGIENEDDGNGEFPPPVITAVLEDRIEGTAVEGARVEIFADSLEEGRIYLGATVADDLTGGFVCALGAQACMESLVGPNLTATATDIFFETWNTSEFSSPVPLAPETSDNCEVNDTFEERCNISQEFGFPGQGLFFSWISRPGDVDWFTFDLPASATPGSLVNVSLTGVDGGDLPANFDLVVLADLEEGSLGSSPLQGVPLQGVPLQGVPLQGVPLQGVPLQGVRTDAVPLQGVPLQGVPLQGVPLQGVPLQGVPLQGVPLQGVPLQGVGFHASKQPEQISTLFRSGMNGTYHVLVWSSTGEFSTGSDSSPYMVTISNDPVTSPPCSTPLFLADDPTLTEPAVGVDTNPETLILVNRSRMGAMFGGMPTDSMQETLNLLATSSLVQGMFVDLGDSAYSDLQTAYDDWDANGCDPELANAVSIEIKKIVNQMLADHSTISNLAIVGNDLIIPFHRVPDKLVRAPLDAVVPNEFDYHSQDGSVHKIGITPTEGFTPTGATLRLQYYLSDDFYADTAPVFLEGGNELSIPDIPIGRLVETPLDIEGHVNAFLGQGGTIEAGASATSLTTGYSFLIDAANAIDTSLSDLTNTSLISDVWDRNAFVAGYNGPSGVPEVTSANAHFDHFRLSPPVGGGGLELVTTNDAEISSAVPAATLFYSIGCHAGFSFWDSDAPNELGRFDWAQVLVGKGASLVGSWGFAYGDDATIAYTEELMVGFTNQFGAGSLGESLVEAKREYLLSQAILDPVHEKILMQTVFYGLPMWNLPLTPQTPPTGLIESHTQGTSDNLTVREYFIDVISGQLIQVPTSRGNFISLAGQTQSANYRSVQPSGSIDVGGVTGQVAHGVLFTGGSYSDTSGFDPVITMPSWTIPVTEAQPLYEGWDPYRFWSLAQLERLDGSYDERLAIVLGQFMSETMTTGTERVYDSLQFEVYYNPEATEFQPPIITNVGAGVSSNPGTVFTVEVEDEASEVVRVIVAYTEREGGSSWRSVDLSRNSATGLWEGTISATDPIYFLVQAVDGAGNVGMFAGNGYFAPIAAELEGPTVVAIGDQAQFEFVLSNGSIDPEFYWDFGDGTVEDTGSVPNVEHSFLTPGRYTVSVRVVDAEGQFGTASKTVVIPSDSDPAGTLLEALKTEIDQLPVYTIRNPGENLRNALLDKLAVVEQYVENGNLNDAIEKLQNDILNKMDGCGVTPEMNDWITDCGAQLTLQALIDSLIAELEALP